MGSRESGDYSRPPRGSPRNPPRIPGSPGTTASQSSPGEMGVMAPRKKAEPSSEPNLACPQCGFQAKTEFGLQIHMGKKHQTKIDLDALAERVAERLAKKPLNPPPNPPEIPPEPLPPHGIPSDPPPHPSDSPPDPPTSTQKNDERARRRGWRSWILG